MIDIKKFVYINKNEYTDKDFIYLSFNSDLKFKLNKTFLDNLKKELSKSKNIFIDQSDILDQNYSSIFSTMAIEGEVASHEILKKNNFNKIADIDSELISIIKYNEEIFKKNKDTLTSKELKTLAMLKANNFIYSYSNKINNKINLTENFIWKIYSYITMNENLFEKDSQKIHYQYRKNEVILQDNFLNIKIRDGISSSKISKYMKDMISFTELMLNSNEVNKFELSWIVHCIFELIHPYNDFNGRVGRLILKHMLISDESVRNLYYFDELILNSKQKYYDFLNYSQDTHDLTFIVAYGYRQLMLLKQYAEIYSKINESEIKLTNIQKRYLRFCSYKVKDFTLKDIVLFDRSNNKEKSILKMLNYFIKIDILEFKTIGKTKVFSIKDKWLK